MMRIKEKDWLPGKMIRLRFLGTRYPWWIENKPYRIEKDGFVRAEDGDRYSFQKLRYNECCYDITFVGALSEEEE